MSFSPGVVLANSGSALIEFPIALYNHLASIITEYPIFDGAPQDQEMPFIDLGESTFTDESMDSDLGVNILFTVHAWSAYMGRYEAKQMLNKLYLALHRADLSVTGYNCISVDFVGSDVIKDTDGITTHGVIQFRAILFNLEN